LKNASQYSKRLEKVSGDRISFKDGKEAVFDAVILVTGYRPRVNDFIQDISSVFDEEVTPTSTGKESSSPGLYFYGYYVTFTGMLREIAIEARQIGTAIAQNFAY
jgi:thioredoxin reductase